MNNILSDRIKKGGLRCLLLLGLAAGITACSDIMETDSNRKLFDPPLNAKTDSIYYIQGMLRGMQQLADQYVLTGEFRGDLISPNSHTTSDLRALSDFSADGSNAYDSAYVYYRVINNCNYYIAHRDTTLLTGSTKVAVSEYVEAKALRAWAYMQLAKNYGTVPFTTAPVTSISDANSITDRRDLQGIADALLPDLLQYSGTAVPDYGNIDAGTTNEGNTKTVASRMTMLPVDLVIADLYLETNRYEQAARHYFKYLRDNRIAPKMYTSSPRALLSFSQMRDLPNDMNIIVNGRSWLSMFQDETPSFGVISFIPMAVNKQKGVISNLPMIFGYDYYTTNIPSSERFLVDRMASPSPAFTSLVNGQDYYYIPGSSDAGQTNVIKSARIGDMRYFQTWIGNPSNTSDSTFTIMRKYQTSNVYIYRENVIYLRLAEALNRMGYPDAAFMILKDGISETQMATALQGLINGYVRNETRDMLTSTIPFLSDENKSIFDEDESSSNSRYFNYGIHSAGNGHTKGAYSPYQYVTEITRKLNDMNALYSDYTFPVISPNDPAVTDSLDFYGPYAIDAVEDLICDELALETAGEGCRWGDLTRIAGHKNADSTHGSNYGGIWLKRKLAFKNPVKDLSDKNNWYLPLR